jgi:hypothetical protein
LVYSLRKIIPVNDSIVYTSTLEGFCSHAKNRWILLLSEFSGDAEPMWIPGDAALVSFVEM